MKITLIFPYADELVIYTKASKSFTSLILKAFGGGRTDHVPPLSLLMIGAVTPPDIEVKLIDERIEKLDFDEPVDLVGISVVTRAALRAYEIAAEYRRRGVKVVLGGIHPSALPKEAAQHADALVLGEGEGVWPELLCDFQRGELKPIYHGHPQMDLDALPFPRWELIRHPEMYVTTKIISATRGCPNTCTFCAAGVGLIKKYRKRSVKKVIEELEQRSGNLVIFGDDNTGWDKEYFKELMRAMIPLHLRWSTAVCINALEDPELVELAAKSGCHSLWVGFESLSPKVLADIRKDKTNQPERYPEYIRRVQEAGMVASGSFIIGFDGDTKETLKELVDFINRTNLEVADVSPLTPYPGSVIYRQYRDQGRLLHQNWTYYDEALCVYQPKQMTPAELLDGYLEVQAAICSWKSLLGRIVRSKSFISVGSLFALYYGMLMQAALRPQRKLTQFYKEHLRSLNP